ncbi:homoserine O-acetyltransferase MetX [Alteribacter populi]|uniref:homoserine O-acetyltransferase MetX n=1 Tax=Alteribacter populi TaxID=2011011 RepID=UPI000BBAFC34|nr:homoserine O-acetyltransferase [Alteribacter populi]
MTVEQKKYNRTTGKVTLPSITLESGHTLQNIELVYERTGVGQGDPIIVCHALTGNHHTVGTKDNPGWWRGLIQEGGYVDLNEQEVITFNIIGGCNGSTGPTSLNLKSNRPYQADFPFVSVRDMVHAQKLALEQLGINQIKAVMGGSLGGMQALEWGMLYPENVDQLIVMAATPSLSDYGMAYNAIARKAITDDPKWNNGRYPSTDPPKNGLSLARMVGMITYRSGNLFNHRFHREPKETWGTDHHEISYQVESYLRYQGDKFPERFDANSYLYLLKAMDHHDLEEGRDYPLQKLLKDFKKPVSLIGFKGDLLYPPEEMNRLKATWEKAGGEIYYYEVDTIFGHDGFLTEYDKWGWIVNEALKEDVQIVREK